MTIVIWIPAILLCVVAGLSYYNNRAELFKIAQSVHNSYVFSMEDRAAMADSLPFVPSQDPRIVNEALPNLVQYARELKPNWIAGVNPGGRVLSVQLIRELDLDE